MGIRIQNIHLYNVIDKMLQGLCYWMGYRMECYAAHSIFEVSAVDVASQIINANLDHNNYYIELEYSYSKLGIKNCNERADLVILQKMPNKKMSPKPVCILEFKLSKNTNGGVWADINKMNKLSKQYHRLAILLTRGNTGIVNDFVNNINKGNERANRKVTSKSNINNIPVSVILSKKARESIKSTSPFRAICIELN